MILEDAMFCSRSDYSKNDFEDAGCRVRQPLRGFELAGAASLCRPRVRVFSSSILPFHLGDSDPFFLRALMVVCGGKTRTLHKNREECGTRKFNTPRKPDPPGDTGFDIIVPHTGENSETTSASGEC
jgi:hypothetical protein